MPNTLLGTNISDTYQKLVQVEGGQLSDGTGSVLPLSFNSDGVTITGTLHANTISSSRVTSSVIYTSGSSTFGDQASDTHTFLGHITASGTITATGNISASGTISAEKYAVDEHVALSTDGSTQGRVFSGADITGIQIGRNGQTNRNIELLGPVTASGNISASSTSYIQTPEIRGHGTGTTQLDVQGQLTASGNISSSGTITALNFTGSLLGTATTASYVTTAQTASYVTTAQTASYVTTAQTASYVTTAQTASYVSADNIDQPFTNITASGNISASGNYIGLSYDAQQSSKGYKLSGAKVVYVQGSTYIFGRDAATTITGSSISLGSPGDAAHVTASGNISSSLTIQARNFEYPTTNNATVGSSTGDIVTWGTAGEQQQVKYIIIIHQELGQ